MAKERSIFLLAALIILTAAAYRMSGAMEDGVRGMNGRGRQDGQLAAREKVNTDNLREILTYKNELDLSVEQVENIKNIRAQNIKDTQSGYEALYTKQLELSDLLAAPKPDFAGAHGMSLEITKAVVSVQSVSIDSYEKAYNLLTESQKMKLAIIREKLKKNAIQKTSFQSKLIVAAERSIIALWLQYIKLI